MSWFSILPDSISFIERWVVRFFIFLAVVTILPWIALIAYDAILYIFRIIAYEIPIIGGRARDRPPPEAPTLSERPGGAHRRVISLPGLGSSSSTSDHNPVDGLSKRPVDGHTSHSKTSGNVPLKDD